MKASVFDILTGEIFWTMSPSLFLDEPDLYIVEICIVIDNPDDTDIGWKELYAW